MIVRRPPSEGYREFPNVPRRNAMQELIEVPALVRLLGPPRGRRILEVGCGRGIALPPLAELCEPARLTGLDIDARLLDQARAHLDLHGVEAELCCSDVREMPFPDGAFDVVIDFGTCYHVNHPEAALREVARVLAEGGQLIHETRLSQLLAHPRRSRSRRLPWAVVPELAAHDTAVLWSRRVSCAPALAFSPAPPMSGKRRPRGVPAGETDTASRRTMVIAQGGPDRELGTQRGYPVVFGVGGPRGQMRCVRQRL